jgi:sulfide:quinone oxidoreductase
VTRVGVAARRDEDRAGRAVQDALGDAADQGAPDRTEVGRADDDRVEALRFGELDDPLGRPAGFQLADLHLDALQPLARLLEQRLGRDEGRFAALLVAENPRQLERVAPAIASVIADEQSHRRQCSGSPAPRIRDKPQATSGRQRMEAPAPFPSVDPLTPPAGDERRPKALIVGGGVGALEAALALRDLAGDRVAVELFAPRREFVYRPFAVGEPYGAARVLRRDLADLADRIGASFRPGGIVSVDADAREAVVRDGERVAYDHLVLAPGARMLWAVPGAVTFWGVADEGGVGDIVHRLRNGSLRNVAFTMPGGGSWALPLYELALLASTVLARSGIEDARLTVVTPEDAPLDLFGRAVAEETSRLLAERGIEVVSGAHPIEFDGGALRIAPGEPIAAEAVVSLPRLEGRRIEGVPHDEDGFVPIDEHSAVVGMEEAFAVGDVTGFPVKQGGIATQQADAAAEAIAAQAGAPVEPAPFDPVLRGVLWTGEESRCLYVRPTGGHGDASSLETTPPWAENDGKIVGRYLSPFLYRLAGERGDGAPVVLPAS